ncbi:hypothetical protein [Listeria seeligeri]|nr:hypothetical protein [Listeria seeligeri]MBC1539415.1 hypothetical protein [Listeria seeligeri]MBC1556568.1 hypothetical protein [Listeria seeligeri]MBC1734144.1 hypothetical protein [Listeria seeligeri]MBC6124270.1 hypothetical protein [Listeria seeligeri]MBF2366814.1 hypothetical protein [Listeria seeligeri]
MKIVLADYWNDATIRLITSLEQAKINHLLIVIQHAGNLPDSIWNPFTYYTGWHNKQGQGLHFNEVQVPPLHEIRHFDAFSAHIYSGDFLAGIIRYFSGGARKVRQVDWLNWKGQKVVSDFYSIQGYPFAYQVYDNAEKPIRKWFLNEGKEEVIDWDLEKKQLILKKSGAIYHFTNLTSFVHFFLKELMTEKKDFSNADALFINSLSFPLFVANELQTIPTTLFFQETMKEGNIPGNMRAQLENKRAMKQIVFETMEDFNIVQQLYKEETLVKLIYLAPLEKFERKPLNSNNVLILTRSDELHHIEEIMASIPTLPLTIAAPTEISPKLYYLQERYPSIALKPQTSYAEIENLLNEHAIYLDIHAGQEVNNVIFRAYEKNYLIVGLSKVAKNAKYEWLTDETSELIYILKSSIENRVQKDSFIKQLQEKNGPKSTVKEYRKYLI